MCVDFCVVNLCDVDNPIKSHQISTILFSKKITNLSILVGEARDLSDVSFILTRWAKFTSFFAMVNHGGMLCAEAGLLPALAIGLWSSIYAPFWSGIYWK